MTRKLFWISLTLFATVLLMGYASLVARGDHFAEKRSESRETYRNQMGWDQGPPS